MNSLALPISIDRLLQSHSVESERLEFKSGWNPEEVLHTMCAFANDFHNLGGGYILIGVDEENGCPKLPPTGVKESQIDSIQKKILDLGNSAIQPRYHPITSPEQIDGKTILIIWVPGGELRPYKAKVNLSKNPTQWGWYIRKQSATVRAKGADEQELISLAATVPFDDRYDQGASINDLSPRLIQEFLTEVKSDLVDATPQLPMEKLGRQMNIVGGPAEATFPKNIGLMFFNDFPDSFFPSTQIDVVWFPEDPSGDRIDEKVFKGPLSKMARDALSYIQRSHIKETVIKHPDRAEADRIWNYPYAAIEEAVINAVYHRSYEIREPIEVRITPDELTVLSFPGPDRSVRIEDLKAGKAVSRRYRNRRIGGFLKELKLTEGRSTGIPRILKALQQNGSPPPVFETGKNYDSFLIRFPAHPKTLEKIKEIPISYEVREDVNNRSRVISTKELVQTLATYEKGKSVGKVKQLIKTSPLLYYVDLAEFTDLDLTYVRAVIEAYSELWNEKAHLPWNEIWFCLLEFCSEVVKSEQFRKKEISRRDDTFATKRSLIISAIGELLTSGTKSDEYSFDQKYHGEVESLISYLLNSESGEKFQENDDKVITAINSPRGWCIQALIGLTLRSCSLSDRENNKDHSSIWERFRHYYDAELRRADIGEFEFSILVTMYLPSFLYMSREWVRTNLKLIFDQENYMKWLCAMEGYYHVLDVYEEVYLHLRKNGDLLRALDDKNIQQQTRTRVIENISIAYINNFESLEDKDSPLYFLINRKNFRELNSLIYSLGKYAKVGSNNLRKKIYELWPLLANSADFSTKQGRMLASGLCHWANFVDYLDDERKDLLLTIAPYSDESHNSDSLLESIARLSDKQPFEANEIWLKMLEGSVPTYPEEAIQQILSNLLSQGEDGKLAAKVTVNKYTKLGVMSPSKFFSEAMDIS